MNEPQEKASQNPEEGLDSCLMYVTGVTSLDR